MLCCEKIDGFLRACLAGVPGSAVLYEVGSDGGLTEYNFSFNGTRMYVLASIANWDMNHLEDLDYNGLYEYLYTMDTSERFLPVDENSGIPEDEFEYRIMKYMPVSQEYLRAFASYDSEKHIYHWIRLGCLNYSPTHFGTSVPEVTDITDNQDGTIALTVNAVCEMMLGDEAVITHELTVRTNPDGSFMYLANKILYDGEKNIPAYQYRIKK